MPRKQDRSLVELIQRVRDETGWSYRELSDRAQRDGHDLSFQLMQTYGKGTARKAPNRAQVDALSVALNVDYMVVLRAVIMQWYGYDPGMPPPTRQSVSDGASAAAAAGSKRRVSR